MMNWEATLLKFSPASNSLFTIKPPAVPSRGNTDTQGVVVFLGHQQGEQLARLVENGTKIYITINKGQEVKYKITNINSQIRGEEFVESNPVCERGQVLLDCLIVTSVLFVSVSFIILMVISLAWLLFYYIQRFRYIHAKDRLARHLCNAAKKALAKIPVKNLKSGDKEVATESECCAVCIEPYQVSDIVRTLPCQHEFHKNCVDPWLLEHRTCPMCKMDILRFYGYVLSDSEESVLQLDMMEDTPAGETEGRLPTPPPPPAAHTRSMPHVSQVINAATRIATSGVNSWKTEASTSIMGKRTGSTQNMLVTTNRGNLHRWLRETITDNGSDDQCEEPNNCEL
ncbi:protein goliath-like [Homarus americanus]|uniref:protein goliath-like n=1 Tax=Homarus americanus TaxID=6706 RepID=UPI001C445750|nr:protein goliath-like [Homarus americanus]